MSILTKHKTDIENVFEVVRKHVNQKFDFDIPNMDELNSKSRKKPYVYFRKMLMILLGEFLIKEYSQEEIAGVVGLDRTSFVYHTKVHVNEYSQYPAYQKEYDDMKEEFSSRQSLCMI